VAIITHFDPTNLQSNAKHSMAKATYSVVTEIDGTKFLQIDTYGSPNRKIVGKKSQSIRLSPGAIAELKTILAGHF